MGYKKKEPTILYMCSDQTPIKHGLPAFFLQRLHAQCPHDLPNGHSRILAFCIFLPSMIVKILLESVMQVDFVRQPGVNGTPVSSLRFLVISLLNNTQPFPLFPVERAYTVNRMVAAIYRSVIARPLGRWYVVVSHKK